MDGLREKISALSTDLARTKVAATRECAWAELVKLKIDLVVILGRSAGLAAQNATTTIPIVMMRIPDPVAEGVVGSLAWPGGNVTGGSPVWVPS